MKKLRYRFTELVVELDRRDIWVTTDGNKLYFEVPKGADWTDLHDAVLKFKPALMDMAGQRQDGNQLH